MKDAWLQRGGTVFEPLLKQEDPVLRGSSIVVNLLRLAKKTSNFAIFSAHFL